LNAAIAACNRRVGPSQDHRHAWTEDERFAGLRLNEYTEAARNFVWNELADWYLESVKDRLRHPGADRDVARAVLVHTFDQALRLLTPSFRSSPRHLAAPRTTEDVSPPPGGWCTRVPPANRRPSIA
jgi:hypothetical protein